MFTLVKKHTTEAETSSSKKFHSFDEALKKFYQYMSNYVADESVKECHITILNDQLIPCKTEHFTRVTELAEVSE